MLWGFNASKDIAVPLSTCLSMCDDVPPSCTQAISCKNVCGIGSGMVAGNATQSFASVQQLFKMALAYAIQTTVDSVIIIGTRSVVSATLTANQNQHFNQTSSLTRYYFSFASFALSDCAPLPGCAEATHPSNSHKNTQSVPKHPHTGSISCP
jgi:hypothetical protein